MVPEKNLPVDDPSWYFNKLVETMGDKNPKMKLLAEFIQRKKASELEVDLKEKQQSQNKLRTRKLKRNYKILLERNNLCASALGSCPYCWGTDVRCRCRGEGIPGYFPPNKEDFDEIVVPALKRLGISVSHEQKLTKNKNTALD